MVLCLRKIQTATHFKRVSGPSPLDPSVTADDLLTPCSPGDDNQGIVVIEMEWMSVPHGKLLPPPVTLQNYLQSLETTKPTVMQADLIRYEEWTNEMGIRGE